MNNIATSEFQQVQGIISLHRSRALQTEMKKISITLIFIFILLQAFTQIDDIEQQILNNENSKSVLISKGRVLLLDMFIESNYEKVKEIKDYMIQTLDDEDYIALHLPEYWLILYWTNEYEELANSLLKIGEQGTFNMYLGGSNIRGPRLNVPVRIRPPQDMLHEKLLYKTKENEKIIIRQIQSAQDIDNERKDFLQLFFERLVLQSQLHQDTLNIHAENFLKTYPESDFNNFVRQYIKYKFVPNNWGFAFDFFGGYGILNGEFGEKYKNSFILGVGLDICYKKFELYTRVYGWNIKTKKDLDFSTGTYPKGETISWTVFDASFGYAVLDNDRFKIAPFAGVGGLFISPPDSMKKQTPAIKEISVSSFVCNFGVNFDLKLGQKSQFLFRPKTSYYFLRLRYNFSLAMNQNEGVLGSAHYITLGIGGLGRGTKREY